MPSGPQCLHSNEDIKLGSRDFQKEPKTTVKSQIAQKAMET